MKKLFLLITPFLLAATAMAQTQKWELKKVELESHAAEMAAKFAEHVKENAKGQLEIERVTVDTVRDAAEEQALHKMNSYVQAILNTGKETQRFSREYNAKDVLNALFEAHASDEEVAEPEIYAAEEFLQYMREHFFTQNPSQDFPDAFTPTFMAKVLRILK